MASVIPHQDVFVVPEVGVIAVLDPFMVYRKLHQNLATFRAWLDRESALYGGGKERLAAKLIRRWRDGTPIEPSVSATSSSSAANRP